MIVVVSEERLKKAEIEAKQSQLEAVKARHKEIGMTLAKYVETLQRSNEQLVKLCGLMSKQESSDELTDKDFAQIFDQIQQSEDKY